MLSITLKTQNSQRLTNHFKEMLITAEYVSQKSREPIDFMSRTNWMAGFRKWQKYVKSNIKKELLRSFFGG